MPRVMPGALVKNLNCKLFLILSLCFWGAGCVTTTDSPFGAKEDKEKAVISNIQLGLAYIERNNMERARKKLNRALELDPNSAGAHAALGLVYQKEGETAIAERQFVKSLKLDPSFTRGRTYYAAFLYAQGRFQEAFNEFEVASKDTEFPSRSQVFSNMGLCAIKLGEEAVALKAYEKSLLLDAQQPDMLISVVQIHVKQKNFGSAQNYFNQFLRMVGNLPGVTHSPLSLYLGIQIADYYGNLPLKNSYADLLRALYPESSEYQSYKVLKND
ncbi:MAG: type IV pilus biogenesis/stability protein PilW [Bdellovibrionales bacterium]|nr:type IV pilus biogenesis/stability protein PilW [Bdellovibrionales bacterium]